MGTKSNCFLFLSFILLSSCGNQVQLANNKLETYNSVKQSTQAKADKSGTLIRKNVSSTTDKINNGSQTINVSKYSSHQALEFIKGRAEGVQVPIRYKGEELNSEIVVEYIEVQ